MEFYKEIILKNGETLTIRIPNIDDAEEMANYSNLQKKETKFLSVGEEDKDFTVDSEKKYIESLNNGTSVYLVGVLNNKIVAHALIVQKTKHNRGKHRLDFGVGVLKNFWGKGIAGKLIAEIIDVAKNLGYEQIELGVVSNNTSAYNLYKSFGFKEQGVRENALKYADGTYENEILMTKFLKD